MASSNDNSPDARFVKIVPEHELIEELTAQVRAGFGLAPFVGSGCSSASGILMGEQFTDYLAWTVCLCVADRMDWPGGQDFAGPRWNLRENGWPASPTDDQIRVVRAWVMREFRTLATKCDLAVDDDRLMNRVRKVKQASPETETTDSVTASLYAPIVPPFLRDAGTAGGGQMDGARVRQLHALLGGQGIISGGLMRPEISPTSEDAILERAIRSLYDWRATLRFLSELRLAEDRRTLLLVEPDQAVIDGFNVHITRGRRPNFTHTMLCHLREPARLRIILTTNFDTLIEDAFAEQHRRLESIPVSSKGSLPDPEIVHARDTVVKLHGTLSETRADFTLDAPPTLDDCRRFFHYVRGGLPETQDNRFLPSHLLVMGYSGLDARCIRLIKFVLDSDPHALLFWVCHSRTDRSRLNRLFPEAAYAGRIIATATERVDLLLYEFYQRLCLSLPPGGNSYQLNHNVPPGSSFRPQLDEEDKETPGAGEIIAAVDWLQPPGEVERAAGENKQAKLIVVDGSSGVLAALRKAFVSLAGTYRLEKIWLELEDYIDSAGLAHELFQIIAIRRGLFQLGHAQLCPDKLRERLPETIRPAGQESRAVDSFTKRVNDWKEHIRLISMHLRIDPHKWLVVVYARNGPGVSCGWAEHNYWDEDLKAAKGSEYGSVSEPAERERETKVFPATFAALLTALVGSGFAVIYAPYTDTRRKRDKERKQLLQKILSGWNVAPSASRMEEIADRAVARHFSFPRQTHDRRKLVEWLGRPEEKDACWRWLDLTPQLSSAVDEEAGFDAAMRAVLRLGLHLDRPSRPKDPVDQELAHPRWRFNLFYGATLFRESRHYTAFVSEGVFRCPMRFNPYGFDNDLIRHRLLERWLRQLGQIPRIFHRKPGGFAWMYRDVRFGMRCLSEGASQAVYEVQAAARLAAEAGAAPVDNEVDAGRKVAASGLLPCADLRARTHFWIGEWYQRAFYISGNARPLMEAAHHFFQCVRHAPEAQTQNEQVSKEYPWVYPLLWWRLGMTQLVRTLRLGGPSLRFWFSSAEDHAWFSKQACEQVDTQVREALEHIRANHDLHLPIEDDGWKILEDAAKAHFGAEMDAAERDRSWLYFKGMLDLRHIAVAQSRPTHGWQEPASEWGMMQTLQSVLHAELHQLHARLTHQPRVRTYRSLRGTLHAHADAARHVTWCSLPRFDSSVLDDPDPRWWRNLNRSRPIDDLLKETQPLIEPKHLDRLQKTAPGGGIDVLDWRKLTRLQLNHFRTEPACAASILQQLVEWSFLLLRRAKHEEHAVSLHTGDVDGFLRRVNTAANLDRAEANRRIATCADRLASLADQRRKLTEDRVQLESAQRELAERGTTRDIRQNLKNLERRTQEIGRLDQEIEQWEHEKGLFEHQIGQAQNEIDLAKCESFVRNPSRIPEQYRMLLDPLEVRGQWVRVCVFASWAVDAEHWCPPGLDDLASREISKALTIYGLALARLHRFQEAQRRFNHAFALLSKTGGPTSPVLFGILDLRRAEALLLEANLAREIADLICLGGWGASECQMIDRPLLKNAIMREVAWNDPTPPELLPAKLLTMYGVGQYRRAAIWGWLKANIEPLDYPAPWALRETLDMRLRRIAGAKCNDAWGCLERAETLMGGRTHSPRWWGRLRALQLRALATSPDAKAASSPSPARLLTRRVRYETNSYLEFLYFEGKAAAPDDLYNCLRMLAHYLRALRNAYPTHQAEKLHDRWTRSEVVRLLDQIDAEIRRIDKIHHSEESAKQKSVSDSLEARYLENIRQRLAQFKMDCGL